MQPSHSEVEERINRIEAEMRRIGMWQEEPRWGDEKNVDDLLLLLHSFDEMFGSQQDA